MNEPAPLPERIDAILQENGDLQDRLQQILTEITGYFQARTCTFHRVSEDHSMLELIAQVGLPPHIAEIAGRIPFGKGMAGICAERGEPVTMCNLQTDDTGVARPAARDTKVEGAVVVPLIHEEGKVVATLGIGKDGEHDYSGDEIKTLERCASVLLSATGDQP
ncbi:MAG: GAF domain-containing protein [Verrucomicrobiales bacterium]